MSRFWDRFYALRGWKDAHGKGTAEDWSADRVLTDLRALGQKTRQLPEILVALAPLYRHEVPTDEAYLTATREFAGAALDDLEPVSKRVDR